MDVRLQICGRPGLLNSGPLHHLFTVPVDRLSPLHYAVQAGNTDIIRHFCQLSSIANLPDSDGRRPLHWAVVEDNPEILTVRVLVAT